MSETRESKETHCLYTFTTRVCVRTYLQVVVGIGLATKQDRFNQEMQVESSS